MAAAASYHNLAAEMSSAATQWQSIITTLTSEVWTGGGVDGGGSRGRNHRDLANQHGGGTRAGGRPGDRVGGRLRGGIRGGGAPGVDRSNRARLLTLQATNFLGVNTPAIALTEAEYEAYWVQDATTMSVYDATSQATGVLQPISPEPQATNPAGPAVQQRRDCPERDVPRHAALSNLSGLDERTDPRTRPRTRRSPIGSTSRPSKFSPSR